MMTIREIVGLIDGELLTPAANLESECREVFASDLMSDVLAYTNPGSLLLTGLVNSHVVRTACLVDVSAIVLVQGKRPDSLVVDEAVNNNMPLIATKFPMFEACSKISSRFPEICRR